MFYNALVRSKFMPKINFYPFIKDFIESNLKSF
uniref:Uncharacterized protein n=1 Tax=Myoviridae sp. ctGrV43 TaxID=2825075 RepID=A0A8S5UF70_9CAUD|nr:MAG TPA: hypothetical protein [Myoviridae sp. ctGrV43]DAH31542.1 MAG TPA: hypothetical protein [Caudoviricetes sp.]